MTRQPSSLRTIELDLHGQRVTVQLLKRRGARSLTIRLAPERGLVKITMPPCVSYRAAEDFLAERQHWLLAHWPQEMHRPASLQHGDALNILGTPYVLTIEKAARSSVRMQDGVLHVRYASEQWQPHLLRFLKQSARDELGEMARVHAEKLGARIAKVGVREMHSRWGSCSRSRSLSFNWRLIFAPREVADYVCAHEAAHLLQHNHSEKFWALVESLDPHYMASERWLKKHGASVFKILA